MRRRPAAIFFALAVAVTLAAPALTRAADGWTLTAAPSSVQRGVTTEVTLRATDTDGARVHGCVRVVVPAAYDVLGASIVGTSASSAWAVSTSGSGPTTVLAYNPPGTGKLEEGDWVEFRITVRGEQAGTFGWTGTIFANNDCIGSASLDPITLSMTVSAPPSTPTPIPTPPPTPAPATPRASTVQSPPPTVGTGGGGPSAPAAPPSSQILPSGTPAGSSEAETQSPSDVPSESAEAQASTADGTPAQQPTGGDPDEGPGGVSEDAIGAMDSIALAFQTLGLLGDFVWLIPALSAGVPGLIVLLLVAVQLVLGRAVSPHLRWLLGSEPPELPEGDHTWWAAGRPVHAEDL